MKTLGKITQHMGFRVESSSCLAVITFNHYATGMDTVPKSMGSLPTVSTVLLPLHHHPPPQLHTGFPLSSRVTGHQGQMPKDQPRVPTGAEHCPAEQDMQPMPGAQCLPPLEGIKRKEDERNNNIFTLTVTQIQISLIIVLSCWEPGEENINHRVC